MRLSFNRTLLVAATIVALMAMSDQSVLATDPEGCLLCHRYRSLARLDDADENVKLFYVDSLYYHRALVLYFINNTTMASNENHA